MSEIVFVGTETYCFRQMTGVWDFSAIYSDTAFRSTFVRGALAPELRLPNATACGDFTRALTTCGITTRLGVAGLDWKDWNLGSSPFFGFAAGHSPKLVIGCGGTGHAPQLLKWNGASYTVLAEAGAALASGQVRFDMFVENYGSLTARCRVWLRYWSGDQPSLLLFDYTGDVSSPGVTALDGLWFSGTITAVVNGIQPRFSEFLAADVPTLRVNVRAKPINAAGDANTMTTGTYADIAPANIDESRYVGSANNGDRILCGIQDEPVGSNDRVLALNIVALASHDSIGPTNIELGLKSGGTEWWGSTQATDVAFEPVNEFMLVNPVTGNPFTKSEINALQIGAKVIT